MRYLNHRRTLWVAAAALGIMAVSMVGWADDATDANRGATDKSSRELAGLVEARIQQDKKPQSVKMRLVLLCHADAEHPPVELFKQMQAAHLDDEYVRFIYSKLRAGGDIQYLQTLQESHPDSPTILYELAMVYIRLGGTREALALLKRAVKIDPFYARANYQLAIWYKANSEPDQAIEYARQVLSVENADSPLAKDAMLLLDKLILKGEDKESGPQEGHH
ncbi:MAG: tetratricopeptide repeat protein [Phycisphaeraceae bacterium]